VIGGGTPRISAEKTLQEARVLFYCVAPIPVVGWFLAASAGAEGLAIFFVCASPVLAACGVALLVRNWRRRNRDGRVWFLALATVTAAAPFLLLILLLVYFPGVGALFP
jgi:uncharacterized membrane protein